MNILIQPQIELELTDEQLASVSGGFDRDDYRGDRDWDHRGDRDWDHRGDRDWDHRGDRDWH